MSRFWIIENDKIVNILEAETLEIAEAVSGAKAFSEDTRPDEGLDIGWSLIDGVWTAPPPRI